MRKLLLTTTLIGTTLIAPGLVPQAQASDWLSVGGGFRVGAAHISFVFGAPGHYGHYGPAYYYRYDRPIRYRGHSCNSYCFRESGHYYHHEACPLVQAHFSAYHVDPYWAYSHYAPRPHYGYDGYYSGGHYGGGHYGGGGYYKGGDHYRGGHYGHRDGYYRGGGDRDGYYRDGRRYGRRSGDGYSRDRYDDRYRGRGRGHRNHRGGH